jgi:FixJ family two-component response regulator
MLSAYADLTPIMAAINHGAIDRFYTKPWKGAVLRETSAKASAWRWRAACNRRSRSPAMRS